MTEEQRICRICHVTQPVTEFYLQRRSGTWRVRHCKTCDKKRVKAWNEQNRPRRRAAGRRYLYKKTYGISAAEKDRMEREQNGLCAICRQTCGMRTALSVDHDHRSGAIRGLLCHRCNLALGLFREDANLLRQALEYLVPEEYDGRRMT